MIRTQVQLAEEQVTALKKLAAKREVSIAELIRQAVERLLRSSEAVSYAERRQRAIKAAGRFHSGRSDLSSRHNEHLSEVFRT